jgi:hypothetical protein
MRSFDTAFWERAGVRVLLCDFFRWDSPAPVEVFINKRIKIFVLSKFCVSFINSKLFWTDLIEIYSVIMI